MFLNWALNLDTSTFANRYVNQKSKNIMANGVGPDEMACYKQSGPSCSKLTMSLVNDSLKFTSSGTQIC